MNSEKPKRGRRSADDSHATAIRTRLTSWLREPEKPRPTSLRSEGKTLHLEGIGEPVPDKAQERCAPSLDLAANRVRMLANRH